MRSRSPPSGSSGWYGGCTTSRQRGDLQFRSEVVDGVGELGFPLSIHFEATYGMSRAAFDTFAAMLAHWAPGDAAAT